MKNLKYLPLVFFYILLTGHIYAQETWQCGVTESLSPGIQNPKQIDLLKDKYGENIIHLGIGNS